MLQFGIWKVSAQRRKSWIQCALQNFALTGAHSKSAAARLNRPGTDCPHLNADEINKFPSIELNSLIPALTLTYINVAGAWF